MGSFSSGLTSVTGSVDAEVTGYPIAKVGQVVHTYMVNYTTTSTYYQIATPDVNTDIYYLGYFFVSTNANNSGLTLYDASAGNAPGVAVNTGYLDDAGLIVADYMATIRSYSIMLPIPYKVKNGIRLNIGSASASGFIIVYYMAVTK